MQGLVVGRKQESVGRRNDYSRLVRAEQSTSLKTRRAYASTLALPREPDIDVVVPQIVSTLRDMECKSAHVRGGSAPCGRPRRSGCSRARRWPKCCPPPRKSRLQLPRHQPTLVLIELVFAGEPRTPRQPRRAVGRGDQLDRLVGDVRRSRVIA